MSLPWKSWSQATMFGHLTFQLPAALGEFDETSSPTVGVTPAMPNSQSKQLFFRTSVTFATVKFFLYIFSAYIFVLGCLPCSGMEHEHDIAGGEDFTISWATDNPCDHTDSNDWCSPLCQCACCHCATSTVKLPSLQFKTPATEHCPSSFTYQAPFSTGHPSALFRPPIAFLG
jgi:hypothetical protein